MTTSPCGRPVGDPCAEADQSDSDRGWPCCQDPRPAIAPCGAELDEQCADDPWCCLRAGAPEDGGEPLARRVETRTPRADLL